MNEMKFLLVETPSKDSVWLHLDTSGRAGVTLWHKGRLVHLEHPAFWLAPHLWLVPARPKPKTKKKAKPLLGGLLHFAFNDARCAICLKDHSLLAQSMCTVYGYQFINGTPNLKFNIKGTLGRFVAVEHFSKKPYIIGITRQPITKAVLQ